MSTKQPAPESTPTPEKEVVPQVEVLSEAERLRADIANPNGGKLREQATKEDKRDFQLLMGTPAQMIAAMTGFSLNELEARAKEIGVDLKGSGAGNMAP